MRHGICERGEDVLGALKRGGLSRELEQHVAACRACGDLALVDRSLREESGRALAEARLPDPGLIWVRARSHGRKERLRRALWPIDLVRWVAVAAAASFLLGAGARQLPWMLAELAEKVVPWVGLAEIGRPREWSLVLAGAAIVLGLLVFDLYGRWADQPFWPRPQARSLQSRM